MQNNLKAIRIAKGMTQEQVAKALGFTTQNRISRWESGMAYPSIHNLLKLMKLYQMSLEEMYVNECQNC